MAELEDLINPTVSYVHRVLLLGSFYEHQFGSLQSETYKHYNLLTGSKCGRPERLIECVSSYETDVNNEALLS